jgi:C4-dicarboxylate-specific signal transduction histidine kinase
MTVAAASPVEEPLGTARRGQAHDRCADLDAQVTFLTQRLRRSEDRRRALLHIMVDMHEANSRLASQRKAMLHILSDYERDRRELGRQAEQLRRIRRALLHILQDSHRSNLSLERSRKAIIHIMGDLHETTREMQLREQELREKQEQLVQAAKLATLGELTTGVAHELNNPLNNIALFVGNVVDLIELGRFEREPILRGLKRTMEQVGKATAIISHLRTFGRTAPVSRECVAVNQLIEQALSLISEQLRLHDIEVTLDLAPEDPEVMGNPIQLEQVLMNLLTNARDSLADAPRKEITLSSRSTPDYVRLTCADTGPGIPPELEQRIFDPFFTTKAVGAGTGLGLSITYGIIRDHEGSITIENRPGEGVTFVIDLPMASDAQAVEVDR